MFVIRDESGDLLHKSEKPILDPRAIEVAAEDVEAKPVKDVVWVTKDAGGKVVDLCDRYPLNPEAIALPRDHPDVVATLQEHAIAREYRQRRAAAMKRALDRLLAEEMAREISA